jgi:NADH:ubiquinone oxidoreductase subunit B-like Fe-S oxidoreductase
MRTLLIPIAVAALLVGCSRTPQPIVEAVKPMQQSIEKAKAAEQNLQQDKEKHDKEIEK